MLRDQRKGEWRAWGAGYHASPQEEDALSHVLEDESNFSRKGSGAEKAVHQEGIISSCAKLQSYERVWPVWLIRNAAEQ